MNYYDEIASGYDELHKEEQLKKFNIILDKINIKKSDKILDVGCGTAFSFDYLIPLAKKVVGVEPSIGLINHSKYSDKIINCGAEELPFKDDEFDWVISLTAIQNFTDIRKGLSKIKRVGKKFALTFLKRGEHVEKIKKLMDEVFGNCQVIEEDKDLIYLC